MDVLLFSQKKKHGRIANAKSHICRCQTHRWTVPQKKKKKKKKNSPLDSDMAKYGIRGYKKVNLWHALHIRALEWVNVKKSESKQNWLEEKKKRTVVKKDSLWESHKPHNDNHNQRKEEKALELREWAAMMNLFRLLGDMTHLLCIVFLLLKIRTMKSCAGTYFVLAQLPLLSLFLFCLSKSMWLDFVVLVWCLFGSN